LGGIRSVQGGQNFGGGRFKKKKKKKKKIKQKKKEVLLPNVGWTHQKLKNKGGRVQKLFLSHGNLGAGPVKKERKISCRKGLKPLP